MTLSELMNIVTACEEVTVVFGKAKDEIIGESDILGKYLIGEAMDAEVLELATIAGHLKVWCEWYDETDD